MSGDRVTCREIQRKPCEACGAIAQWELTVQTSWFRGDDEVVKLCFMCRSRFMSGSEEIRGPVMAAIQATRVARNPKKVEKARRWRRRKAAAKAARKAGR